MRIYYRQFVTVCFFLFATLLASNALAQDAMFSQYYAAPLYLNPSLAGAETNVVAGMNYRTQGSGLSQYKTAQVSLSYPLVTNASYRPRHIGGIGGTVFNETAGENHGYKNTGFLAGGAYNLAFDKYRNNFIALGLQGGIIQKRIDGNFNWGSQYDPSFGFNSAVTPSITGLSQTVLVPVVNAGFTFFYNSQKMLNRTSAFFGFAASNMNMPNESFIGGASSRLPMLFKAHGGVDYRLTRYISISHNLLMMSQNGIRQLNAGTYLVHKSHARTDPFTVTAGAWYRYGDSFIFLVGFSKSMLSIGFSYDLNASSYRYTSGVRGANEISLTYRIPKVKTLRRFLTPLL